MSAKHAVVLPVPLTHSRAPLVVSIRPLCSKVPHWPGASADRLEHLCWRLCSWKGCCLWPQQCSLCRRHVRQTGGNDCNQQSMYRDQHLHFLIWVEQPGLGPWSWGRLTAGRQEAQLDTQQRLQVQIWILQQRRQETQTQGFSEKIDDVHDHHTNYGCYLLAPALKAGQQQQLMLQIEYRRDTFQFLQTPPLAMHWYNQNCILPVCTLLSTRVLKG